MHRAWRTPAVVVLGAAAVVIAVRAVAGPFSLGPVAVNSPMNVEGFFALLLVALILSKEEGEFLTRRQFPDWIYVVGLAAIVVLVFWRSLWFPLLSDDYILVTQARGAGGPLLKSFVEPGGDGSFRPLGQVLLMASGRWANTDALRWHAISFAIHGVNSILLYAAVRYASKRSDMAVIAAAVFALHGTRPEAVAWTAGRWDVVAAFFALAGLLAFLRYYERGNPLYCTASVVLAAMAILCKESAYAFPALALALTQVSRSVFVVKRLLTVLIAPAVMLVYRFVLFHGPGGYIDPQTGRAQILSIRLLPSLKALFLRLWAVLLFPVDWAQKPELYLAAMLVLMLVCLAGLCVVRSSLDRRSAVILAACTMGCAFPAVHLLAVGADLLGSRVMYLPAAAYGVFVAALIVSVRNTRLARGMAVCVVLFYMSTLAHNLGIWGRVATLAYRTCASAAPKLSGSIGGVAILGIPVAIDGVPFFANGFAECVALHDAAAPSQWTITHLPGNVTVKPGQRVLVWDAAGNVLR